MTRAGTTPALVALAVVFAGCGGDGGSVTTDASALVPSKRDYIVQADTICGRATQRIETEAEVGLGIDSSDFTVKPSGEIVFKPGRAPSSAQVERFGTEVVVPALRDQLADLRGLTPPRGDEATVTEIFDIAEKGVDTLAADPTAFNDRAFVRRQLSQARSLARQYGFFDCGTYSGP
jgi:hypothetical protein